MAKFSWIERLSVPTYDNEVYATTGRLRIDLSLIHISSPRDS